jgi:hypothetical protein
MPQDVVATVVTWAGWQPVTDLFATQGNQQFEQYAARYPTAGALCDAFGQPWNGMRAWAYPPFSQADRVCRHLSTAVDAKVLLVVPLSFSVPECVRVVGSYPLPPVALIGPRGDTAVLPCPVELIVHDICPHGIS